MLENVQGKRAVERSGHRAGEHVMREAVEAPFGTHALVGIFDKERIEVDGGHFTDLLANDSSPKSVCASDLEHVIAAAEHFRYELVTRECKREAPGIVIPSLIGHEPKGLESLFFEFVENRLIFGFAGFSFHRLTCSKLAHVSARGPRVAQDSSGFQAPNSSVFGCLVYPQATCLPTIIVGCDDAKSPILTDTMKRACEKATASHPEVACR